MCQENQLTYSQYLYDLYSVVLTEQQADKLFTLSADELSDIDDSFYSKAENFCDDNDIEYPYYSYQNSLDYFQFFSDLVNPTSENYNETFHFEACGRIARDRVLKASFISFIEEEV